MKRVLVLNADFKAFDVITWQDAMKQILTETKQGAYVVEYYPKWNITDSAGRKHPVPAVIALKQYRSVGDARAPYSNTNVKARDRLTCQYCGKKFKRSQLTIDHVIPRSRWDSFGMKGKVSSFENTVACCSECNKNKADLTCQEARMFPKRKPQAITCGQAFKNRIEIMDGHVPKEWLPYLEGIKREIR